MVVTRGLWSDVFRVLALDRRLSGASLCSCFSNFRFHLPKTGSIVDGDRFDKAFHLLGPRVGQSLRKPGDGKIGWRGALDDRRHDPWRNEGERRQEADVAFAERFAVRDVGEGRDTTEPEIFYPSAGPGDGWEQCLAGFAAHRLFRS